ncbi:hypothetical protein AURDEDRAFT_110656 [Auricularia subglabra TFB-10046 SS5]|nr:hypothetical protein AURDEDRAFT_110656 [Auricularia subglabra TFB-10046 SS5]
MFGLSTFSTGSPSALSLFAPAHSPRDTHALYSELFSSNTNAGPTSRRAQVPSQQRGSMLTRVASDASSRTAISSVSSKSKMGVYVHKEVHYYSD